MIMTGGFNLFKNNHCKLGLGDIKEKQRQTKKIMINCEV